MSSQKRIGLIVLFLALSVCLMLAFGSCQNAKDPGVETEGIAKQTEFNESEATANDFRIKLYTDKSSYTTNEAIQVWATLEYVGSQDTVTIWHGDPYLVFSITNGADFTAGGLTFLELKHTELEKGKEYRFDYVKSGEYDAAAADAEFWEAFYQEEDLKLLAGTYTILADGKFYLSEQQLSHEKGPSCELQITVQ